jgi:segregation and condensation protein B
LQARADAELEADAPREQTSFRSLLAELDSMETGLKTDFDDLRDEVEDGGLRSADGERRDY